MTTNQPEYIQIGANLNMQFEKVQNQSKIENPIASGVKNNEQKWIECKISGILFDPLQWGVSKRRKIHPRISQLKNIAAETARYRVFFEAIEYCKNQNYTELKQFEEVLLKVVNGSEYKPREKVIYNYEIIDLHFQFAYWNNHRKRSWVALITGLSQRYHYKRTFLKEVEEIERTKRFYLSEDGIYQVRFAWDQSDIFLEVIEGNIQEITSQRVIDVFGDYRQL